MGTGTRIRVSCTALARIEDDAGNLALYASRKDDRTILRPPGGSFQSGSRSHSYLATNFGATMFEHERDLRFTVPTTQVDRLVAWFGTRQLRETGVTRVLAEQLIDRARILAPSDARHLTQALRGRVQHRGITARDSAPIKDTLYLVEVFDIGAPSSALAKLAASPRIVFVSPDEIRRDSNEGGRISSMATCLLVGA
ncbi:MAG TPA: hypothetical protein VJM46_01355 [Candidatus Saccharimonadales bacterium]|nr:hypothetical protein [Candidatus Saccharimonadales bacterium]